MGLLLFRRCSIETYGKTKKQINMNEKLQKQIDEDDPVTQEHYDALNSKTYSSGRPINIGDKLLWAIQVEQEEITESGIPDMKVRLISLHQDEYDTIYEDYTIGNNNMANQGSDYFPFLKLKNK
jgi:hypothetical protein